MKQIVISVLALGAAIMACAQEPQKDYSTLVEQNQAAVEQAQQVHKDVSKAADKKIDKAQADITRSKNNLDILKIQQKSAKENFEKSKAEFNLKNETMKLEKKAGVDKVELVARKAEVKDLQVRMKTDKAELNKVNKAIKAEKKSISTSKKEISSAKKDVREAKKALQDQKSALKSSQILQDKQTAQEAAAAAEKAAQEAAEKAVPAEAPAAPAVPADKPAEAPADVDINAPLANPQPVPAN